MQVVWLSFLISAALARNVPLLSRDTTIAWNYTGCYQDSVGKRTLAYASNRDYNDQTTQTCTTWCAANKFSYCGTEYGSECYGDYTLPAAGLAAPESGCSMPCAGNSSQVCGNGNRLSVYTSSLAESAPSTNPGPDGWSFLACYTDSAGSRTLGAPQGVAPGSLGMTVAQCAAACGSGGYRYAGVEYANECYCDNAIHDPGTIADSGCNMACPGNSTEFCGGSNRLNIYRSTSPAIPVDTAIPAGWTDIGCFTDNGGARTLGTQQEVPGGYTNMTVEGCLGVCMNQGYAYAGVEYSQECYCGNSILDGGTCASDQKSCYMPCRGNAAETCGGPDRLNVYFAGSSSLQSSCAASSATSSTSATGSSTSSTTISVSSSSTSSSTLTSSASDSDISPPASSTLPTSSLPMSVSISSSTETPSSSTTLSTSTVTSNSGSSSSSSSTTSTLSCPSASSTVCPSFWAFIVAGLAPAMRDSTGGCTDFARATIRFAFHDAATFSNKLPFYAPAAGGADGSLLLSANEINRADNAGLHVVYSTLTQKLASYRSAGYCVGAADLVQVAGSLGVLACPGGRIGRVFVGRTDSTVESPDGLMPAAFGPASSHDVIFQLFQDKGFSARDLAALIGAHSTSKANFETDNGIPAGTPQDDTPGVWDVKYYNQTYFPVDGMARFDSDVHLSNDSTTVGRQFKTFVGNQGAWGASFSSAWQLMSILGIPRAARASFADCTTAVVAAFPS